MRPASTRNRRRASSRRSRSSRNCRPRSGGARRIVDTPRVTTDQIAGNLRDVRARIADAARRAGRHPADITLVAVSKTFDASRVRAAWEAGQREFGENKVQEGEQKIASTSDLADVRWHLIGHLQSNKARKAAASFHVV